MEIFGLLWIAVIIGAVLAAYFVIVLGLRIAWELVLYVLRQKWFRYAVIGGLLGAIFCLTIMGVLVGFGIGLWRTLA